jgi:hypothetical protein
MITRKNLHMAKAEIAHSIPDNSENLQFVVDLDGASCTNLGDKFHRFNESPRLVGSQSSSQ